MYWDFLLGKRYKPSDPRNQVNPNQPTLEPTQAKVSLEMVRNSIIAAGAQ